MNEKIGNLLIMCVCFGVGASVLLITNGQEPEVRIPTGDYQSFSGDGRVEDTEKGTPSINSGSKTTVKLIESKRGGDSKKDRSIEIKAKSGLQSVLVRGFPEDSLANQIATYAWEVSNHNIDFLAMLRCENGGFDMYARGDSGKAVGLCQMSELYHKIPAEYYTDWKFQIRYCYDKWSHGTKFYGPNRRIKGGRCGEVVMSDFIF